MNNSSRICKTEYYIKSHAKKLEKLRAKKNGGKEVRNLKLDAALNLSGKPLALSNLKNSTCKGVT